MAEISLNEVVEQIRGVLREAFEGPAQSWSYFTDHGPEAGYFGTLKKVTAAEASEMIGGSSIAAHVHHIVFSLDEASSWIRGDHSPRDWKESWAVQKVDDAEWSELLDRLRNGYAGLQDAIASTATESVEAMGGAVGVLAHAAFHFGAVRQKVLMERRS